MTKFHDMGGRTCNEAICRTGREINVFEREWHARALAATLAAGMLGAWNIDASRHARECLAEEDRGKLSYYENWMAALANLLVRSGLVTRSELANPANADKVPLSASAAKAWQVDGILNKGSPTARETGNAPRFHLGQTVRASQPHSNRFLKGGHTRLPHYVQGRTGTICRSGEAHILPDSNAHHLGEQPEHLYSVRFSMAQLWQGDAERSDDEVVLDLWESYLEAA